jgi:hypothetical protein
MSSPKTRASRVTPFDIIPALRCPVFHVYLVSPHLPCSAIHIHLHPPSIENPHSQYISIFDIARNSLHHRSLPPRRRYHKYIAALIFDTELRYGRNAAGGPVARCNRQVAEGRKLTGIAGVQFGTAGEMCSFMREMKPMAEAQVPWASCFPGSTGGAPPYAPRGPRSGRRCRGSTSSPHRSTR